MKHRIKNILLIGATLLTLGGCQKERPSEIPPSDNTELKFKLGFAVETQTDNHPKASLADINSTKISTKVATDVNFSSSFEDGDQIGIFVVKHRNGNSAPLGSTNLYDNIRMTYNAADQSYTTDVPLYYPTDGEVIDVYAYYPYNAQYTNPLAISFSVDSDQSEAKYNASDLIVSAPVINAAKGQAINLIFNHLLSMIEVRIPLLVGRYQPTSTTKVTLQNITPKAALDLSGTAIMDSQASTTNITLHRVETVGTPEYTTRYTYRALVPAQTIAAGQRLLEIDSEGLIFYDSRLTEPLILSPGSVNHQTRQLPLL